MKLFYATSITFPSLPVNRLQTLQTARGFATELGTDFTLGACAVDPDNDIYKGPLVNFGRQNSIALAYRQLQYIKKHEIDIVFGREPAILWGMMLLNQWWFRLPLRFFYEAHDVNLTYRDRYVCTRVDHIFCVSAGIASDMQKHFPHTTMSVQRNGVNVDLVISESKTALRQKFQLPEAATIVSYVGSIGRYGWKGEDVLLAARTHISDPKVHIVIAGVKDAEVAAFTAEHGSSHTTILGRLNEREVAELQALSDIVVLPNKQLDAMSERYTSPIKMFEYMRSGTPILASKTPSIQEVLTNATALFFTAGDPKALADGIAMIGADQAAADRRARAARTEVAQYSWRNKAKNIITQLQKPSAD